MIYIWRTASTQSSVVKQGKILGSKIKAKSQGHRAKEMAQWQNVRTLLADDQSWFSAAHNCL